MAFGYTNSKGNTYYLHAKGKMFFFSKEIKEGVLEALPAGYTVSEMKTGMLVLKRIPAEGEAAKPAETPEASS